MKRLLLQLLGNTLDPLLSRITIDPAICHGKPCVRGLHYPVDTLLELLSSGMTHDQILSDYEDLEQDDLFTAIAYGGNISNDQLEATSINQLRTINQQMKV